jgi:hypothetical protein
LLRRAHHRQHLWRGTLRLDSGQLDGRLILGRAVQIAVNDDVVRPLRASHGNRRARAAQVDHTTVGQGVRADILRRGRLRRSHAGVKVRIGLDTLAL